ncbi:TatD family hydrolase [Accumulibacter sp.]|uniref:TatD family hydrolase n=1 Tax=Accumulibacter sp. TaxID=2053492 RepID=UPI0025F5A1AE|nr:TatD family hydrolase [Accumulibacter sp.]MCM8611328.1 TatD family hydrolase [Accumulibacter sp.]MCM8635025.1 TatD family hydrolase [Accumulibacter sp.]MCM8639813.1 TatD family hydrolase [Accumulibacter sp.]
MLVDSHCHLDFPQLADRIEQIIGLMRANDVGCALCIGVTLERLARVLQLADTWPMLLATVGVHPEETGVREATVDDLVRLAAHPRVVAIGETGLDYYWHKDAPEWQRERFRTHIRAARVTGKPLVIHTREAAADTLRLMAEEGAGEVGGIMHCFTESWPIAQAALDLGFHISLSGIVTFKNALTVREVALRVPLDRLLVETDSPYLAPVPYRGKTNQPAYVRHVAEDVARLRGLSYQQVADATTANFFNLFPEAHTKVAQ